MRSSVVALLVALVFCGTAIAGSSTQSQALDDASAGLSELNQGNYSRAIALFDRSIASNGLTPRDQGIVIGLRGLTHHRDGDYESALQDYNAALRLQPDNSTLLHNRGLLLHQLGKDDDALADYNSAIELGALTARAYFGRGVVEFDNMNYQEAARDFLDSARFEPNRVYAPIWLYLANGKLGRSDPGVLERFKNTNSRSETWPRPVIGMELGMISPEDLLSMAKSPDPGEDQSQDPHVIEGRVCEAGFYIGEYLLLRAKPAEALQYFQDGMKHCPKDYYELSSAKIEASRLEKQPRSN